MKYPKGIRQRGLSLLIDVTVNGVRRTGTVPLPLGAGADAHEKALKQAIAVQAQMRADLLKGIAGERAKRDVWTLKQAYEKCRELYWTDAKSGAKLARNAEFALDQTINRKMSALSRMLTLAVKRGKISSKPTIERKREGEGRIRFLSSLEEQQVLSVFDQWSKDEHSEATIVLIDTGLRGSELWRMTERDIDFLSNLIHVWETKNTKPRSIPMTSRVKDILWRRCKVIERGPLFPYNNFWFEHVWDRMKEHLGLGADEQFVPYCLRHTCASRLVQRGVTLLVVMEWLGHKNIQTTMRYSHLCPTNLHEAAKVLEQA